jgi:hypothetical protein
MKKSAYSASKQHIQPAIPKNKKAKSAPHSKSALTKIKPKATINIPTREIRSMLFFSCSLVHVIVQPTASVISAL